MYLRSILIVVSVLLYAGSMQGQYISSVTIPDSSAIYMTSDSIPAVRYAQTITAKDMREHLTILASDKYEGRETGKDGNAIASSYIAYNMGQRGVQPAGLDSSFYQPVAFTFTKWLDTDMYINGERFKHLWDYLSFPQVNNHAPLTQASEVIYLGYGIEDDSYNDYRKVDVKGKVIMINKGEPVKRDSVTSWITGDTTRSEWSTDIMKKLRLAKSKGVEHVLIIEDDIKGMLADNRRKILGGAMQLGDATKTELESANHCYISTNVARAIIGQNTKKMLKARKKTAKKGKNVRVTFKNTDFVLNQAKEVDVLESRNVVGMVRGSEKPEEYVVVSAHFDHLGKRGDDVYNGADDNGSGTTTIMEIAEAFATAARRGYGPKRTVVFVWFTGEEKGLLGSAYYAANPIFPLEATVADVNVDMVGRVDKKYEAQGIDKYIYVIGSDRLSTDLHKVNEEANQKYTGLVLDYTYNDANDSNQFYFRSDHYNFAKNGVPSIFFFNGTHDDYHMVTDTVDKINFDKMEAVGRHIFHTVWELANRSDRIVVDGVVK